MGLKQYIFGAIILIAVAAGYVFSLHLGEYTVHIKDFELTLPIEAWVAAPAVVLFVFSVLHILFYGTKNYFKIKSITKDTEAIMELLRKKLVQEEYEPKLHNEQFKELASIINQLTLYVGTNNFSTQDDKITKAVEQVLAIQAGEYIPTKELKLSENNPLYVQNTKNKIQKDDNFALEVLKNPDAYSEEIFKLAFKKVIDTKSMTTIKKLLDSVVLDKEMSMQLLKKDSEQKSEFALDNEQILKIIQNVNMTNDDLITIAKWYKDSKSPDMLIKLYEDIIASNDKVMDAYLYVLSEFQVIDKIREILDGSKADEFSAYKALVDLRDAGKHSYSLETLCYKKQ